MFISFRLCAAWLLANCVKAICSWETLRYNFHIYEVEDTKSFPCANSNFVGLCLRAEYLRPMAILIFIFFIRRIFLREVRNIGINAPWQFEENSAAIQLWQVKKDYIKVQKKFSEMLIRKRWYILCAFTHIYYSLYNIYCIILYNIYNIYLYINIRTIMNIIKQFLNSLISLFQLSRLCLNNNLYSFSKRSRIKLRIGTRLKNIFKKNLIILQKFKLSFSRCYNKNEIYF